MNKEIFALDIGTRKVMGIYAHKTEECLEILEVEVLEHPNRAMFDGQIHSIEEVTKTVKNIKGNLESRLGKPLKQVGVAIAGRNLITYRKKITHEFDQEQDIDQDTVRNLELEAVDKMILETGARFKQFYCVGYSPVYYQLDGVRLSSLVGHRGRAITIEIIVTFLPRIALDSMLAVLKKCDLDLVNITLEPISAINAIIPSDMRNLNLLLVDIGAGTSDLALTKEGVIFGYGMVPEAGDEITERISEILLVDFPTAERIKRSLDKADSLEYEDIWGRQHKIDTATLKDSLLSHVKQLAENIAKEAIELNGGVPQAVVIVGGGSLTFGLIQELAYSFGLPLDKVGIRLPSMIKGIKDLTNKLTGPEAVTPIGIALMTANSSGLHFIDVEINKRKIRMLDFYQKKDIMSALTLAGIDEKKLYPHPGLALSLEVNGELKVIKGTLGEPAKIFLNGKPITSLSDKIEDGDVIEVEEAQPGKDAFAFIKDVVDIKFVEVFFNGQNLKIIPSITMNEQKVDLDTPVVDRANIKIHPVKIRDLLNFCGIDLEKLIEKQILINVNGNPKVLTQRSFTLSLNGLSASLDAELKPYDVVEFAQDTPTFYRIKDVIDLPQDNQSIRINVDGRDINIEFSPVEIFMNGRQVKPDEFLIDGADIRVYNLKERRILLSEIFRYIDLDLESARGKRLRILVNDSPAGFTTHLTEGAKVRILFEDMKKEIEDEAL
ncbi:MAG: rod shape-determining protein [Candidatus Omnitrophica bacterium]|nr:rod shape-determining protein [Candidatus Omnitrophota bacterium]